MGRSQIKRLDENNKLRSENLALFLESLDPTKYRTDFETAGSLVTTRSPSFSNGQIPSFPTRSWRNSVNMALNIVGAPPEGKPLQQPYFEAVVWRAGSQPVS